MLLTSQLKNICKKCDILELTRCGLASTEKKASFLIKKRVDYSIVEGSYALVRELIFEISK